MAPVFPFERPYAQVEADLDVFAEAVIATLESSFTTVPIGAGFVHYPVFESGYEALRRATRNFSESTPEAVVAAIRDQPIAFVVLRTILGFSPPEWAHVASNLTSELVSEGYARSLDKRIRTSPANELRPTAKIEALIQTACRLLQEGPPEVGEGAVHRLDKADTRDGTASLTTAAQLGMPYAMLLYERLLGRPFATVRDAYSEKVGDLMEVPVEERLVRAGVPFRKTKHAERLHGFEQAPDFVIPDEFNPAIVIEAKITEDAGTARDKVTRIQHLHTLSRRREEAGEKPFSVIACIDGRGFATRREDMKKVIRACHGKVFTLRTLGRLIECSPLEGFRPRTGDDSRT